MFIKSTKETWVELPNMHLELSIMEHGSNIFLEVKVGHKNLQDIFTKLVLSLWYPRWNEIDYDLEKC